MRAGDRFLFSRRLEIEYIRSLSGEWSCRAICKTRQSEHAV